MNAYTLTCEHCREVVVLAEEDSWDLVDEFVHAHHGHLGETENIALEEHELMPAGAIPN